MAKLPVATTVGFMVSVADFLDEHKATLTPSGYDPTADIAKLRGDANTLSDENQTQENMKAALKTQTMLVEQKNGGGYDTASGILDAAVGKLGKSTPAGQQGARLRSLLRGRDSSGGGEQPPPPPAP
jgi:hypothetical protein